MSHKFILIVATALCIIAGCNAYYQYFGPFQPRTQCTLGVNCVGPVVQLFSDNNCNTTAEVWMVEDSSFANSSDTCFNGFANDGTSYAWNCTDTQLGDRLYAGPDCVGPYSTSSVELNVCYASQPIPGTGWNNGSRAYFCGNGDTQNTILVGGAPALHTLSVLLALCVSVAALFV